MSSDNPSIYIVKQDKYSLSIHVDKENGDLTWKDAVDKLIKLAKINKK